MQSSISIACTSHCWDPRVRTNTLKGCVVRLGWCRSTYPRVLLEEHVEASIYGIPAEYVYALSREYCMWKNIQDRSAQEKSFSSSNTMSHSNCSTFGTFRGSKFTSVTSSRAMGLLHASPVGSRRHLPAVKSWEFLTRIFK